ncbi:hypothetical protein T484DRAFT_1921958 [Baffinella frigidus]|nr:hypothetical protein T484DRAFT_1921958 [Cryptophyta sp. CCMP2293]
MVCFGGMQLTVREVLGRDALPPHGEINPAVGGLLGLACGTVSGGSLVARQGGGSGAGGAGYGEARVLALSTLALWPRLRAVVPPHVVTAAVRRMWAGSDAAPTTDAAGAPGRGEAVGRGEGQPAGVGGGGKGDGQAGGGGGVDWGGAEEVLLLVSLLVTRDLAAVGEAIRSATRLACQVQGEALTKLADMLSDGAGDARLLSRGVLALSSQATPPAWTARAQCVAAVLRENRLGPAFDDHVRFSAWLLAAIRGAALPLSATLPALVQQAALLSAAPDGGGLGGRPPRILSLIPTAKLTELLHAPTGLAEGGGAGGGEHAEPRYGPPALLAALYLLARVSALSVARAEAGARRRGGRRGEEEGGGAGGMTDAEEATVAMLPLRLLLRDAEAAGAEAVYAPLLQLVLALYPEVLSF